MKQILEISRKKKQLSSGGALGKLNWAAGMTRPKITFNICELSTKIKTATTTDIDAVNKVIKFIKSND